MRSQPVSYRPDRPDSDLGPAITLYRRLGFEIAEVSVAHHEVTFQLCGELDAVSAPLLPAVINHATELNVTSIRLDLSRLRFCDCAGLQELVHAYNDLTGRGIALVLAGLRPNVRKLLSISRLDEMLSIDEDAAHGAFRFKVVDETGSEVRNRRL